MHPELPLTGRRRAFACSTEQDAQALKWLLAPRACSCFKANAACKTSDLLPLQAERRGERP